MDENQLFQNLCTAQNGMVYAALLCFGLTLKKTPFIPDWFIPYILGIAGMGIGYGMNPSYDGALTGFILAGLSVFGHQLYVQFRNRLPENPPQ